jgi:ribosome-associated translation inhibitor RaiA
MRPAVSETENARTDVLDEVVRLGAGFTDGDRPWVLERLSALVPHVARWDPADLDLEISVKHRDAKEQQVTLRADLPGYPPLVASAVDRDLDRALAEAKRELIRQVEDEKKKRDPKNNRLLRKKTP